MVEHAENIVLGGGEAGKYIAWELAKQGHPTMVIERQLIGGSCPKIPCLPRKNVIRNAKVADLVRHANDYGTTATFVATDMQGVRRNKRKMVEGMVEIHRKRFAAPGVQFVLGEGRFVGPRTIDIHLADGGVRRISGERIFLNLGTRANIPEIPGMAATVPLTHVEALELEHLPAHLIVIGGGYVGVEFAQAFRRFGSQVTVVQRGKQLLPREYADVAEAIMQIFEQDGIEIILGAATGAVEGRSGDQVRLLVKTASDERVVNGTHLLVATGRTPNTRGIGLDIAGVDLDSRGFVKVNERLQTTASGVWAVGECAGSPQFTHVAFDDFRVVRDNFAGTTRTTKGRLVPYCAFMDPQLGRVGLSEAEARRLRVEFRIAKLPMSSVLRARAIGETRGFMKALIDVQSDRILGFTMLGADAGEVIAVVQTAMLAGLPYTGLRDAILTHPTMAEGLNVLFANVVDRAVFASGSSPPVVSR